MKAKSSAQKIVSHDGLDIYYWITQTKEKSRGFKVLHAGASMNHSSWQDLEKGLNDRGFSTLVFDMRGLGFSDRPKKREGYKLPHYTDDLKKIIEREGIENPSFITHSFGFIPVVDYVAQTKNAKDIVGMSVSYNFMKSAPNKLLFYAFNHVLRYSEFLGSAVMYGNHVLKGEKRGYSDQSGHDGKTDFDVFLSIVDASFKQVYANTRSGKEICNGDITKQLKKIETPIHLIYGDKDPMVGASAGEHIAKLVKGECTVDVIHGQHSLPMTKVKEVFAVMDKYI